jgi:hypothetical protein
MRGSEKDLPKTVEADEVTIRETVWGDMHVDFETYHKAMDLAPLLKGLPDDRCQCPHWGFVLKGRMRVKYRDHEEVMNAGDAYYMAPDHSPIMDPGTDELKKTSEVITRNFAAMQKK